MVQNSQDLKIDYLLLFICMTALESEINYYLTIAIDINKKVGGKRGYQAEADCKDKFLIQKENINKEMHFVKAKLQERQRKAGAELLGINMEIKDKIQSIFNQLDRMKETIQKQKNASEAAKDIKNKIVEQLREKTKRLQQISEGSTDIKALTGGGSKNQTLTQARELLLDHEGTNKNTYRVNSKKKKGNQAGPTQIQLEAMERWKKNDQAIDDRLDDLTQRTIEWKKKVKQTGDLIDQSDKKIDDLTEQVDKVNQNLLRSNKQLKGIIQQYRKPHKFCIDIILVLVLVGMIVGIVKVAQK